MNILIIEKILIAVAIAYAIVKFVSWIHIRFIKPPSEEQRKGVIQRRVLYVNEVFDATFDECSVALKLIRKLKIKKKDKKSGVILANVGMTFASFGEKIKIVIIEKNTNVLEIQIESKPRFWPVWVDYGKKFHNVEIVVAHIKSALIRENELYIS